MIPIERQLETAASASGASSPEVMAESELYLTLARAFSAPAPGAVADAFRTVLADDLLALADELHLDVAREVEGLRESLKRFDSDQALLVHYSRLFLSPPVPVHLNLAHYFVRARSAYGMDALIALLRSNALQIDAAFHDQPDHLVLLLEVMALRRNRPGEEALHAALARYFLVPVIPPLRADLVRASPRSPYLHLLDVLWRALDPYRVAESEPQSSTEKSAAPAGDRQHCRQCGRDYASAADLQVIVATLVEAGLPTDHLYACPDCRVGVSTFFGAS